MQAIQEEEASNPSVQNTRDISTYLENHRTARRSTRTITLQQTIAVAATAAAVSCSTVVLEINRCARCLRLTISTTIFPS